MNILPREREIDYPVHNDTSKQKSFTIGAEQEIEHKDIQTQNLGVQCLKDLWQQLPYQYLQ